MRTNSLDAMWTSSNKVLFKEEVTDKLRKCLDVPRVFFSWLLLYCQQTIAVQQEKATQVEVGKAPPPFNRTVRGGKGNQEFLFNCSQQQNLVIHPQPGADPAEILTAAQGSGHRRACSKKQRGECQVLEIYKLL